MAYTEKRFDAKRARSPWPASIDLRARATGAKPVGARPTRDHGAGPGESPFDTLGDKPAAPKERNPNDYIKLVDINTLPSIDKIIGYEDVTTMLDILAEEFAATVNVNPRIANSAELKRAKDYIDRHGAVEEPMFNVFLEGVSGTGKTTMMGAMARRVQHYLGKTKLTVWKLETGLIEQGIVGESQKALTNALNAVLSGPQPCFVIIDEADSLFATKVPGVHEVTLKLAGVFKEKMMALVGKKSIMVFMATNNISRIDDAIKAPHRTRRIGVGLPSTEAKYHMMDKVIESIGLPCDIPMADQEAIARSLRGSKATGAHFDGLKRAIQEARTAIIKGVEMGRIPFIIQKKVNGKMTDVLLQPKDRDERANKLKAKSVEQAKGRTHIDSASGNGPEKFGLQIEHNGVAITSVKMVELTKVVLNFAVGRFEGTLADDLESLANAK